MMHIIYLSIMFVVSNVVCMATDEILDYSSKKITDTGIAAAIRAPKPMSVKELVSELNHPKHKENLKHLNLRMNSIFDQGAREIVTDLLPKLAALEELDLSGNKITTEGLSLFKDFLETASLFKYLNIVGNPAASIDSRNFFNSLSSTALKKIIWVSENWLEARSWKEVIKDTKHAALEEELYQNFKKYYLEKKILEEKEPKTFKAFTQVTSDRRHDFPLSSEKLISDRDIGLNSIPIENLSYILEYIGEPEDYASLMAVNRYFRDVATKMLEREINAYSRISDSITSPTKQWFLACAYLYGRHTEKNIQLALQLLEKAAKGSHNGARYKLGLMYLNGDHVEKDPIFGFVKFLLLAAKEGYASAQLKVGEIYFRGEIEKQDEQAALEWYRKAAEQGNAKAMFELGRLHENRFSPFKDDEKAAKWFYNAAQKTNNAKLLEQCLVYLGNIDTGNALFLRAALWQNKNNNHHMAITDYRNAFEKKHPEVLNALKLIKHLNPAYQALYGELLLKSSNYESREGFSAVRAAAEKGCSDAMNFLGNIYLDGEGINRNINEALNWYERAALNGNRDAKQKIYKLGGRNLSRGDKRAQFIMGKLYQNEKRDNDAFLWFQRSADQGYILAAQAAGIACILGKGTDKSPLQAMNYLREPAARGYIDAQYYLGKLLLEGERGVDSDIPKAIELLGNAREQNHPGALFLMGKIYHEGIPLEGVNLEKNDKKAFKYIYKSARMGFPEALEFLKDKALSGETEAEYYYGRFLRKSNDEEGKKFLIKASLKDHPLALQHLKKSEESNKIFNGESEEYIEKRIKKIQEKLEKMKNKYGIVIQRNEDKKSKFIYKVTINDPVIKS